MAIQWPEIQYRREVGHAKSPICHAPSAPLARTTLPSGKVALPDGMLDPVLTFPKQPEGNIGKYGGMRRDYLQQHRKAIYARMSMEGTLKQHLMDVNEQAKVEALVEQMQQTEPMPDKNSDPLDWIQRMNSMKAQAEEIVRETVVYA